MQNVAKGLGYANAAAGRFVGMDIVDPPIDYQALSAATGAIRPRRRPPPWRLPSPPR